MPTTAATDHSGRTAASPWAMPWPAWRAVLLRTWREAGEDNVGLVAAGVAFYGFLALVPLLGAIVLSYGLLAEPSTVVAQFKALTDVMPADAARLIGEQLMNVVQTSSSKKGWGLMLALGVALFGARNGAGAIMTALNIAYEETEQRSFVMVNLTALAITAGAVAAAIAAVLAIAALASLDSLLPGAPDVVLGIGKVISHLLLLLVGAAGAATLFRFGPSRAKPRWVWLTPGSLLAATLWLALTLGFGIYAANFGDYNATYGSLSAVVVLLTWLYLSSYVLVFAAELNAELEHQTARDTTTGLSAPLGERGAWVADHVAAEEAPAPPSPPAGAPRPASEAAQGLAAARAGRLFGARTPGFAPVLLAVAGLTRLRRPGGAAVGATLLAGAGGLAWLGRQRPRKSRAAVLFDIDGTLIDSNDLHVDVWDRVFRDAGHAIPREAIHAQIGKGGDKLVPALLPQVAGGEQKRLADAHGQLFKAEYLARARPFPGAAALVRTVDAGGARVVLASSASRAELDHYIDLLGIADAVDSCVTIDDVAASKPAGDIFTLALHKLDDPDPALVRAVGDTPYDVKAAAKAGVRTIGLLSGGFSRGDLAGAERVYADVADLHGKLRRSPLGALID